MDKICSSLQNKEISVAPMMDWTDRHFRYFMRLISPHCLLYTEMITTGALIHGEKHRFLKFSQAEHPIALQLGGSDPSDMARSAELGQTYGYNQININCGCPSERVQKGAFGACLMAEPNLVAANVAAMQAAVDIPVTVKCRIGIDDSDDFIFLDRFVDIIADKGCKTFIVHARKAWLKGLSPKENREIPPLMYERVYALKNKYPHLRIILNGGIKSLVSALEGLEYSDGVMIGREAYQNPWFMREIEHEIFGNDQVLNRNDVALKFMAYMKDQHKNYGVPIKSMTRHILGLFYGQRGGKNWRRTLSTLPYVDGADETVIIKALEAVY